MKTKIILVLLITLFLVTSCSQEKMDPSLEKEKRDFEPEQNNFNSDSANSLQAETKSSQSTTPSGGPYLHQIYSASSTDGLTWTSDDTLILDHTSVPDPIYLEDGTIRIYYVDANQIPETVNCAESVDGGETFTVLDCEIQGLENAKALDPSIIQLEDGSFRLYFYESKLNVGVDSEVEHTISYADSDDGIQFTKKGTAFTYNGLVDPDVFWNGNEWVIMVYSIADANTVVGTSADGTEFTYYGPVSDALSDIGTTQAILLDDGSFRIYGFDQNNQKEFYSFTSNDGFEWTKEDGVRYQVDEGDITDPQVIQLSDGTWKMFYKTNK